MNKIEKITEALNTTTDGYDIIALENNTTVAYVSRIDASIVAKKAEAEAFEDKKTKTIWRVVSDSCLIKDIDFIAESGATNYAEALSDCEVREVTETSKVISKYK